MATQAGFGLDLPGGFDEEQAEIERRRLQLIGAMKNPIGGAGTGWGGGIANFLQGVAGNTLMTGQDDRSKDLAARRAAYAEQAMADLGRLDKPAVPEQVGTGPIAPPPGTPGVESGMQSSMPAAGTEGPPAPISDAAGWIGAGGGGMVPQGSEFKPNAAGSAMIPGSLADRLKIVSRLSSAGPMYAKVAEKVLTQGLEAPEKAEQARLAREDKARENALTRASKEEAQAYQRNQQEYLQALNHSQQELMAAVNSGHKEDQIRLIASLKALHAGASNAGNLQLTNNLDNDGTPLAYDKRSNKLVRVGDGGPPQGTPQSRSTAEKGAMSVRDADAAIGRGTTALQKIENYPGAFGGVASVASGAADLFGTRARGAAEKEIYTPEELEARAYIGREGAQILKDLYGAAVTRGEGNKAKPFEYEEGLPPEAITARIKAIMAILSSKTEAASPASKALARPAGTPGTPAATKSNRSKYGLE